MEVVSQNAEKEVQTLNNKSESNDSHDSSKSKQIINRTRSTHSKGLLEGIMNVAKINSFNRSQSQSISAKSSGL
jgi:hypothetical protein